MKVLAISGHAGSGKDTAAGFLTDSLRKRGRRVLVTHYADLLKYICKSFFDWDGKKDENGRKLLQYVGTDVVRERDQDFWVGFIVKMLVWFGDNWDFVIIPDTRFPNEIDALRDAGLSVLHLRVLRKDYDSGLTEEQKNHPSETALDNITADRYINNNHSIEVLKIYLDAYASILDDEYEAENRGEE